MTEFDTLPPHLRRLGRQLVAAADELHASGRHRRRWRWPPPSRRAAAGLVIAALAVPAAAIATTQLITTGQVAASLPQGTLALMGTHPQCTVVRADVEYHCVLQSAPSDDPVPQAASAHARGGRAPHRYPLAVGTEGDGKQVFFKAPTMAALKREIAGAKVTHVLIGYEGQLRASRDGTITMSSDTKPPATDWKGAVEETVDATKHVNGGCRARNTAGTDWECYIGEAAVGQKIISQGFLGQPSAGPAVG